MQNLPPNLAQELETLIQKIVREAIKAELQKNTQTSQDEIERSEYVDLPQQNPQDISSSSLTQARSILQRVMNKPHLITNQDGFLSGKV